MAHFWKPEHCCCVPVPASVYPTHWGLHVCHSHSRSSSSFALFLTSLSCDLFFFLCLKSFFLSLVADYILSFCLSFSSLFIALLSCQLSAVSCQLPTVSCHIFIYSSGICYWRMESLADSLWYPCVSWVERSNSRDNWPVNCTTTSRSVAAACCLWIRMISILLNRVSDPYSVFWNCSDPDPNYYIYI